VRYGLLLSAAMILGACTDSTTSPSAGSPAASPDLVVAASNTWVSRADMPGTVVSDFAAGSVTHASGQSIVYAVGGRRADGVRMGSNKAYNVATNTWSSKADLPTAIFRTNGIGVIQGKLYLSGGYGDNHDARNTLYVHDPTTNSWARKRDMPSNTYNGLSGVIEDKLYVLSNCTDDDACSIDPADPDRFFYRYDPVTDQWASLPLPAQRHYWGMAAVIGKKFYVVGGLDNNFDEGRTLEVYDPATNQWTTKTPLPRERFLGAGTAVGGKLYVISGYGKKADGTIALIPTTSIYDPATNSWTNQQAMPSARAGIPAVRVALNGQPRAEVIGGSRPGNNVAYIP
jgi:N-acetylneuraminic acid mutarotase